jgi:hypothetical protein
MLNLLLAASVSVQPPEPFACLIIHRNPPIEDIVAVALAAHKEV